MFTGGVPQDPTTTGVSFADLGLSEPIVRPLDSFGFKHPTPIQEQAISIRSTSIGVTAPATRRF